MAITRWDAVVDAVIAAVDAATTAAVFDAVPVTDEYLPQVVIVGARADDERGLAGTLRQTYHDLGASAKRDETGTIYCSAISQTGDDDIATVRAAAIALVGVVESTLRADFDLGLADVLRIEVALGDVFQGRTAQGVFCEVEFTVEYTALI